MSAIDKLCIAMRYFAALVSSCMRCDPLLYIERRQYRCDCVYCSEKACRLCGNVLSLRRVALERNRDVVASNNNVKVANTSFGIRMAALAGDAGGAPRAAELHATFVLLAALRVSLVHLKRRSRSFAPTPNVRTHAFSVSVAVSLSGTWSTFQKRVPGI